MRRARLAGLVMAHTPGWLWRRLPGCITGAVIDAWLNQCESVRRLRDREDGMMSS